jgi:LPPG:FO 2-phospho-L-lactate transferase
LIRRDLLDHGFTLSAATDELRIRLGIAHPVLPMSDDPVFTRVATDDGELDFQRWFVDRKAIPVVRKFIYSGAEQARPSAAVVAALADPLLTAIIICPSNPFLSIDPILALPGMRTLLRDRRIPIVAISPIVNGKAVKGPAASLFAQRGIEPSSYSVARHYQDLIDGIVIDVTDQHEACMMPQAISTHACNTIMACDADEKNLADEVLRFAASLT